MVQDLLLRGALTLGLSLIIGIQRERTGHSIAGIRTFPLIGLFGFFATVISNNYESPLVLAASLLTLTAYLAIGLFSSLKTDNEPGITTEVAAVLVFLIGAFLVTGPIPVAIAAAGLITLLLYLKEPLHGFASRLQAEEFKAIMQLVLIALVVLPLLPNESYDKYDVLNPKEIWFIVTLITGISVASHVLQKWFGRSDGALVAGILGGLISSTASTFTFSRRSRTKGSELLMTLAVIIASTASIVRVLLEVIVIAPQVLSEVAPPLLAFLAFMIVISFLSWRQVHNEKKEQVASDTKEDPAQLKAALIFAIFYAVILYGSAFAKDRFGTGALYLVSIVSGLIDVDALTLSTAKLVASQNLPAEMGWRFMLTAALSNLTFKAAVCAAIGYGSLRWRVPVYFGTALFFGIALILFWPSN